MFCVVGRIQGRGEGEVRAGGQGERRLTGLKWK